MEVYPINFFQNSGFLNVEYATSIADCDSGSLNGSCASDSIT
jgi:hypothetical protein